MLRLTRFCLVAALICAASLASAQTAPTLDFTVNAVAGPGSIIPTLKWAATPAGAVCTAAGNWTGTQPATGQVTQANVTGARAWTLSCVWSGDTSARLSWAPPDQNADNTPFTNPGGVRIWYGKTQAALDQVITLTAKSPPNNAYEIKNLTSGQWFFQMAVMSDTGVQGLSSTVVSKTITEGATRTVTVTLNPPKASVLTVQ